VTDRYGELTYTSYDAAGSAGGWQIKQQRGALSDEETQLLVSQVQTVFEPPQPLPAYPTPAQVAALPRRLAYRNAGAGAYWHSVPAGPDATGRPGNVFSHVMLDRGDTQPGPAHRPIQLWRSADWLCPYGTAVAAAQLPPHPPRPSAAITADSVLQFALDTSTWRLGVLLGLLDAVAAAMTAGPPVLLGVDSPDAAAHWIGLISLLMSAGTARTLNFSTFERVSPSTHALRTTQHLTAVPRTDLDNAPPGVVAIDDTEMLSLGEFGGEPHRTAAGQTIDVTAWSAMTQVALLDLASARLLLADIDTFAAQVNDTGLHPAWPMAMSVLTRAEFSDAAREARTVIAMHSPLDLPAHSPAGQALRDVLTVLGDVSTAEAWRLAQHVPEGLARQAATEVYLHRAIADGDWLDQSGPIPLHAGGFSDQPVPEALRAAVGPALNQAAAHSPARLVRLVDLLVRAGLYDGLPPPIEAEVASLIADPSEGPRHVEQLGDHIDARTRLIMARAALHHGWIKPAAPLPGPVLDWLATGLTAPAATALADASRWDDTWVTAALCGARSAAQPVIAPAERFHALWWQRICGAPLNDLRDAAGAQCWDPAELLIAIGDAPLPSTAAVFTLVGAPPSTALDDLASRGLAQARNDFVVACAVLRLTAPAEWAEQGSLDFHTERYGAEWNDVVADLGARRIHRDVAARLVVLAAMAAIEGRSYARRIAKLGADTDVSAEAITQLLDAVERGAVRRTDVAAAGLLATLDSDESSSRRSDPVDALLGQVAQQLATAAAWTEDDVDTVIERMDAISDGASDSELRRFRKLAAKTLSGPSEGHSSLAARLRRSH
jgi:hypothetical protein